MQEVQDWQIKYDALKADHDALLAQRKAQAQGADEGVAPDANGDAGMPSAKHGRQTALDPDGDGVHSARDQGASMPLQRIAELEVCTADTSMLGQPWTVHTIILRHRSLASSVGSVER